MLAICLLWNLLSILLNTRFPLMILQLITERKVLMVLLTMKLILTHPICVILLKLLSQPHRRLRTEIKLRFSGLLTISITREQSPRNKTTTIQFCMMTVVSKRLTLLRKRGAMCLVPIRCLLLPLPCNRKVALLMSLNQCFITLVISHFYASSLKLFLTMFCWMLSPLKIWKLKEQYRTSRFPKRRITLMLLQVIPCIKSKRITVIH